MNLHKHRVNLQYINEGAVLYIMKDNKNAEWTMEDVAHQYKIENPDWAWKKCWVKAKAIYRELNKSNNEVWENNKRYFQMNTPFSFFDNKDGEFSDTPWDGI